MAHLLNLKERKTSCFALQFYFRVDAEFMSWLSLSIFNMETSFKSKKQKEA